MSTKIEWTDETWNPLVGCTHLGPGCDNCYAAREASGRLSGHPVYAGLARKGRFTGEVRLLPERLEQPLRWRRPRRVFVNSMSDLFHRDVPSDYIARVFAVMSLAGEHTFQVLTKRAERLPRLLGDPTFPFAVGVHRGVISESLGLPPPSDFAWPLPNVWLGVSVETERYGYRIQHLIDAPATVRFLSVEPLLGPVSLWPWLDPSDWGHESNGPAGWIPDVPIHWVIVGGESGPGARPMHPGWARTIRDECQRAGVPFLFKQWGEHIPVAVVDDPDFAGGRAYDHPGGGRCAAVIRERGPQRSYRSGVTRLMEPGDVIGAGVMLDRDTIAVKVGKKDAGRTLDGRTWDEYPDA